MIETERSLEGLSLRDRLYAVSKDLTIVSSGISLKPSDPGFDHSRHPDALAALKDDLIIDILLQRQSGQFPLEFLPVVEMYQNENPHSHSRNKFNIKLPIHTNPEKIFTINSKLSNLRRNTVTEDSLQALGLLTPFEEKNIDEKSYFERTIRELEDIERTRNSLKPGSESEKRKDLRELMDNTVVVRFLEVAARIALSSDVKVKVETLGSALIVIVVMKGHQKQTYQIEDASSQRYRDERNERLAKLLEKLKLAA